VLATGSLASAAVSGTEYTSASVNPVSGYLVQSVSPTEHVTQISSYIGSNNSHSLAALPVGTHNGFGIEVCNSDGSHNRAIQVGIVHTGTNTMDVDWAVGDLGSAQTTNANACLNGVLANFGATVHQLLTGVPINDTVNVQLTYDNGSARDRRGDRHHIGQWLVTAQVVPNGEYTTFAGGVTPQTAWVAPGTGHFNMAAFGTEANASPHLTPLSAGSSFLGACAHMRLEYNSDGTNDYTFTNLPGAFTQTLEVDATSNGDAPADGGVTYIKPTVPKNDAFNVNEGALVS
jgi:hypothetical protein